MDEVNAVRKAFSVNPLLAFAAFFSAAFLLLSFALQSGGELERSSLEHSATFPNGSTYSLTLACTPYEKERGLGGLDYLQDDTGMLFVFEKEVDASFWMKGMRFPLDIAWLDSQGRVREVESMLEPCRQDEDCPSYNHLARYVLEVKAGEARQLGVAEGAIVALKNVECPQTTS